MRKIIIVLIILCTMQNAFAATSTSNSFNGNGLPEYPNEGYIFVTASSSGSIPLSPNAGITSSTYDTAGNVVNYYIKSSQSTSVSVIEPDPCVYVGYRVDSTSKKNAVLFHNIYGECGYLASCASWGTCSRTSTFTQNLNTATNYNFRAQYSGSSSGSPAGSYSVSTNVAVLITTNATHKISGITGCLDDVSLYYNDVLVETNYSLATNDHYIFENLLDNGDYKLIFSDSHQYEFNPTSDMIYNYDVCTYTTINLNDYCGNKLWGMSTDIYTSDAGDPTSYEFLGTYTENPIQLQSCIDVEAGKMLDIYIDTDMGDHHEILYADNQTHTLFHPYKYWRLTLTAKDDQTLNPISGVKILANQSCKIDPDRPLTTQLLTTANGKGTFSQLSGENVYVSMWKTGYKVEKFFVGGIGDCFKTDYELIVLMNTTGADDTEYTNETENVSAECSIFFTNENGKKTNRINDTDSNVYLNYTNGNCSATLKFQRLYGSYWMTKQSWNIPALESGSKTIPNTNFSYYDANYRAYMYSYTCDCNSTLPLYVLNQTVEEEEHYQNLSTNCWFKYQLGGGQVDYKSPVEIVAYANATDAFLLDINLTLYNSTGELTTYQCNWADFSSASVKWYYIWQPPISYQIGENYTVIMTGYNGHKLDADEVWTSDIYGNELTVFVKDNYDQPVTHSTVFVEGWGAISTGDKNYVTITGFPADTYQYKATKAGYISSGWASIELDNHESVTCILVSETQTSITASKMTNAEIKAFFIPLMYLLLIMMLLGAFKFACGGK